MAGLPVARTASEVVDETISKLRPASPADVHCHGLAARRPADGRPEVVNDHIFNQIRVFCKPMYENLSVDPIHWSADSAGAMSGYFEVGFTWVKIGV